MNKYTSALIIGLIIAAIWGFFADLQNGQTGWFISRLIFTPLVTVVVFRAFGAKGSPDRKENA